MSKGRALSDCSWPQDLAKQRWQCQLSILKPSCAPTLSATLHLQLPDLLIAEEVQLKQMQQELKETQSHTKKQSNVHAFPRQMMKGLITTKATSHSPQASAPSLDAISLPLPPPPAPPVIISTVGLLFSQVCVFAIETHCFILLFLYRSIWA